MNRKCRISVNTSGLFFLLYSSHTFREDTQKNKFFVGSHIFRVFYLKFFSFGESKDFFSQWFKLQGVCPPPSSTHLFKFLLGISKIPKLKYTGTYPICFVSMRLYISIYLFIYLSIYLSIYISSYLSTASTCKVANIFARSIPSFPSVMRKQ